MAAHQQLQQQHQQQQQQALNSVLNSQNSLGAGTLGAGFNNISAVLLNSPVLGSSSIPSALSTSGAPRSSIDGLLHLFNNDGGGGGGGGLQQHAGLAAQLGGGGGNAANQAFLRDGRAAGVSASAPQDLLLSSNTAVAAAMHNSGFAWTDDCFGSSGDMKPERMVSPALRVADDGGQEAAQRPDAPDPCIASADDAGWQVRPVRSLLSRPLLLHTRGAGTCCISRRWMGTSCASVAALPPGILGNTARPPPNDRMLAHSSACTFACGCLRCVMLCMV